MTKNHVWGILLLLVALVTSASSAPRLAAGEVLPACEPHEVGMSAGGLQKALDTFRGSVEQDEVRGAVLLVARRGKIVLHEAVGWRNVEKRQPFTRDTLLQMASNTKAVIATAALILAERGRVDLNAEVGKYLPAFNNENCRGMKVRHLLSHTSGLRLKTLFVEPLMKPSAEHPDAPNLQLEVSRIGKIGPTEAPGKTYSYSNAGYNTLGALIEVCSGMPLEAFLIEEIYHPLGMLESSNHPDPAKTSRMAVVYAREKNGWKIRFQQDSPPKAPFVRGSGGMISTAADFARFCQTFLNGGILGDRRILSRESVGMATSPQTPPIAAGNEPSAKKTFYGFGWSLLPGGIYAHGGSEGTYAWIDPKRQLIVLVLTQSPGSTRPRQQFIELVAKACDEECRRNERRAPQPNGTGRGALLDFQRAVGY